MSKGRQSDEQYAGTAVEDFLMEPVGKW
jgi:hypothetical protein